MNWGLTKKSSNNDLFDRSFESFFDNFLSDRFFSREVYPSIDIEEEEDAYHLKAEIPGIDEKDMDVSLKNGILTIRGEKKFENEQKSRNTIVCERRYGSFSRTVQLPENIKGDQIKATYKNGILSVDIPKSEKTKPRQIKIDIN